MGSNCCKSTERDVVTPNVEPRPPKKSPDNFILNPSEQKQEDITDDVTQQDKPQINNITNNIKIDLSFSDPISISIVPDSLIIKQPDNPDDTSTLVVGPNLKYEPEYMTVFVRTLSHDENCVYEIKMSYKGHSWGVTHYHNDCIKFYNEICGDFSSQYKLGDSLQAYYYDFFNETIQDWIQELLENPKSVIDKRINAFLSLDENFKKAYKLEVIQEKLMKEINFKNDSKQSLKPKSETQLSTVNGREGTPDKQRIGDLITMNEDNDNVLPTFEDLLEEPVIALQSNISPIFRIILEDKEDDDKDLDDEKFDWEG